MYQPSKKILDKYADVLVNFALNSGQGIKKNEVVFLQVSESAKPLLVSLYQAVLKTGAHAIIQYSPDDMARDFFDLASDDQLKFFPAKFLKGKIRQANHFLTIISETNKHELEGVDPKKIMERSIAVKPYIEWRQKKENKGNLTWALAMYATPAMAQEAKLTLKQCWQQIIKSCYLNHQNPVKKWQRVQSEIKRLKNKLDKLDIEKINIKSKNTDLSITIGKNRQWLGGDGRNIPSFEVFISPDWRGSNGHIYFDQPLYRHGNIIKDVRLEFKDGCVTKIEAKLGQKFLEEMIKVENANKIGEFSLTDKRMSKINKFMAETLYDENFGGEFGNTHIAIGSSFKESYTGKVSKLSKQDWQDLGFNESAIHTDIISTENRIITAYLSNGQEKIIYQDGKFVI